MSRPVLKSILAVLCHIGCIFSFQAHAEPKKITLPMIEVPDELTDSVRATRRLDRGALLKSPIELSDKADRLIAAREQVAWKRLSGSLCAGCGETQRARRVDYVDPIAVLNAKPVSWRPTVIAARTVQPTRTYRVRLAHRHRHRSRLYAYIGRVRYALLKWRRHHHHHHRVRVVQR